MFPGAKGKLLRVEIVPVTPSCAVAHIGIGFDVENKEGQRVARRGHTVITRHASGRITHNIEDRNRAARIQRLAEELMAECQVEMEEKYKLEAR